MTLLTMNEVSLSGRRVLIREDFNVPIVDGQVVDDTRIRAAIPGLSYALEQGAAVIILSHLGRPIEGEYNQKFSLAPVAKKLSSLLSRPVRFESQWLDGVVINPGEVVLCENVRFNQGEKANSTSLAKKIAALGDVFVMDAFGSAHRAHASTHGVVAHIAKACAGPLLLAELAALSQILDNPKRPLLAIVGGAKVSSKLKLLENLLTTVDQIIVGGGIANTFLAATGIDVAASLFEPKLITTAQRLLASAKASGKQIIMPEDVIVTTELSTDAVATACDLNAIAAGQMIVDVGAKTQAKYTQLIMAAGMVLWNGPVGVFEFEQFATGTASLARAIAKSSAYSVAGGGETLASINNFISSSDLSYVSTGGGAFLAVIEGKTLPAIAVLPKENSQCCVDLNLD